MTFANVCPPARWDVATGVSWTQIFSSPSAIAAQVAKLKMQDLSAHQQAALHHEIDASFPCVFSRNGYGVAEQMVFPASSWLGVCVYVCVRARVCACPHSAPLLHISTATDTPPQALNHSPLTPDCSILMPLALTPSTESLLGAFAVPSVLSPPCSPNPHPAPLSSYLSPCTDHRTPAPPTSLLIFKRTAGGTYHCGNTAEQEYIRLFLP